MPEIQPSFVPSQLLREGESKERLFGLQEQDLRIMDALIQAGLDPDDIQRARRALMATEREEVLARAYPAAQAEREERLGHEALINEQKKNILATYYQWRDELGKPRVENREEQVEPSIFFEDIARVLNIHIPLDFVAQFEEIYRQKAIKTGKVAECKVKLLSGEESTLVLSYVGPVMGTRTFSLDIQGMPVGSEGKIEDGTLLLFTKNDRRPGFHREPHMTNSKMVKIKAAAQ